MNEDGALFDSGFDGRKPFPVTPETGGISLESALRDFGPAAIDDLIPRVRAIARTLDAAHAAGVSHGALHPSKVIITEAATQLIAGEKSAAPYLAPEITAGGAPSPASDQYALAAIAYEWLFGRPISGPAERPVEVRGMPGVDRVALSKAFTRALSPQPQDRFASCGDFCTALLESTTPELPFNSERENAFLALDTAIDPKRQDVFLEPLVADLTIADEETTPAPDLGAINTRLSSPPFDPERASAFLAQDRPFDSERASAFLAQDKPPAAVASWNPTISAPPERESPRFSGMALILAAVVGSVFGFAAGYMARPRALQTGQPQEFASAPGTANEVAPSKTAAAPKTTGAPQATDAPTAPQAPEAPKASASARTDPGELRRDRAEAASGRQGGPGVGRLLVRSAPSGATVSVEGVSRGTTPLALRDLEVGTLTVTIARRGYIPETRKVQLSRTRPSRSLEVRLTAEPAAAAEGRGAVPPKRAQPPAREGGQPAVSTGSMVVDSRPAGAAVAINGKPSGKTPLTINDLAPGDYQVTLSLSGYRSFATTVRVVAGERARAAASLTAQEQE